jgi:hypothetical protein
MMADNTRGAFSRAPVVNGEQRPQNALMQQFLLHVDATIYDMREAVLQQAEKHHEELLANQNKLIAEMAVIKTQLNALANGQIPLQITGTFGGFNGYQPAQVASPAPRISPRPAAPRSAQRAAQQAVQQLVRLL